MLRWHPLGDFLPPVVSVVGSIRVPTSFAVGSILASFSSQSKRKIPKVSQLVYYNKIINNDYIHIPEHCIWLKLWLSGNKEGSPFYSCLNFNVNLTWFRLTTWQTDIVASPSFWNHPKKNWWPDVSCHPPNPPPPEFLVPKKETSFGGILACWSTAEGMSWCTNSHRHNITNSHHRAARWFPPWEP